MSDGGYNNYKLYYTIMLQFPRQQGDIRIPILIMPRAFMNICDDGNNRMETSRLRDARYGTTTHNILLLTSVVLSDGIWNQTNGLFLPLHQTENCFETRLINYNKEKLTSIIYI